MLHSPDDAAARRIDPRADQPDHAGRHRDHRAPDLLAVQPDPRDPRGPPRHRRQRPVRRLRRWPSPSASSCSPGSSRPAPSSACSRSSSSSSPSSAARSSGSAGSARSPGSSRRPSSAPSSTSPTRSRTRRPPTCRPTATARSSSSSARPGLEEVAETGVMIHGDVSADLLRTIFAPRTALHDGAVIIRGETILAAGALLPLAETTVHTERFGTRHRAALGITEQTDAVVVVVSEENGQVSLVERSPDRPQPQRGPAGAGASAPCSTPADGRAGAAPSAGDPSSRRRDRPRRPHGPRGEATPRGRRPQLAPQARGDRPRDPAVRRTRALAEHARVQWRRPGHASRTSPTTRSCSRAPEPVTTIRYFAPVGRPADRDDLHRHRGSRGRRPRRGQAARADRRRARSTRGSRSSASEPDVMTVELDALEHEDRPGHRGPRRDPRRARGRRHRRRARPRSRCRGRRRSSTRSSRRAPPWPSSPAASTSTRTSGSCRSTSSARRSARWTSSPPTARVRIPVFTDRQSRTLPVNPVITGTPAAGFEIASVTVEPSVVTVEGDGDQLVALETDRHRADLGQRPRSPRTTQSSSAMPTGVVPLGASTVDVTIELRPVTATRSFDVGPALRRRRPGAQPTTSGSTGCSSRSAARPPTSIGCRAAPSSPTWMSVASRPGRTTSR